MRLFLLLLLCLAVPGFAGAAPVSAGEVFTGGVGVALLLFSIFLALLWTLVPFMVWDIRKATRKSAELLETDYARQVSQQQQVLAELRKLNATLGGAQIDRE